MKRAIVLAGLLAAAPAAFGHGLTAGQGALQLTGGDLRLTLTPSAGAFPFADDDGDGLLGAEEIAAHRDELVGAVRAGLGVWGADGTPATPQFIDVLVGEDHHTGARGDFVKIMASFRWEAAPAGVVLRYNLFAGPGDAGLTLSAVRAQDAGAGQLRLGADTAYERITLRPAEPLHAVLALP